MQWNLIINYTGNRSSMIWNIFIIRKGAKQVVNAGKPFSINVHLLHYHL